MPFEHHHFPRLSMACRTDSALKLPLVHPATLFHVEIRFIVLTRKFFRRAGIASKKNPKFNIHAILAWSFAPPSL
jgi:hypothetical protein